MRAAAVQLTVDPRPRPQPRDRRSPDPRRRRMPARSSSCCRRSGPLLGTPEQTIAGAEPFDGPALSWARAIARELGIDLVAGSFAERDPGRERGANTSVHVGPDGEVQAIYRKIHMFDVEVGGRVYKESEHEAPGDEIVLSRDRRRRRARPDHLLRPALPGALPDPRRARRAQIIAVPAAFTLATTRDHWEVLLRARAIEDQAFVVAANQVGEHAPGFRSGGRSMIVDPWGVVLAQAPDSETFIIAELDLDRQAEIRRTLPSLANRRPEAYRWPTEVHA